MGAQIKRSINQATYESKVTRAEGGHFELMEGSTNWLMPPYLRDKQSEYPVATLTAIRLGSSNLQRNDEDVPCVASNGSPRSPTCPQCGTAWGVMGPNRHLLMHCQEFSHIRISRMGPILSLIREAKGVAVGCADRTQIPLNEGEVMLALLGKSPPGLMDPGEPPAAVGGAEPEAGTNLRAELTRIHQLLVARVCWMIQAMEKAAGDKRRRRNGFVSL
jgi:hypothetical protein